jgi:replicative DNA helicase
VSPRRGKPEPVGPPPVMSGRVPPHDLDAEAATLSACLLDRTHGCVDIVSTLLAREHFYSEPNGRIWQAILALREREDPVDVITVASELRSRELIQRVGGTAYIGWVADATPAINNVETHAKTVLAKARLREMIATCQVAAAEGYGDVGDPEEWLGNVEGKVLKVAQSGRRNEMMGMRELVTRAHRRMDEPESDDTRPRFATGFEAYDEVTGTMRGGHLVVIAARPGMGKSALVSKLGILLAARHGFVAEFHLELDKDEATDRMIAQRSWVSLNKVDEPLRMSDAERGRVVEVENELAALPIEIDDTPALTLRELQSKARGVAHRARRERERRVAAGEPLTGLASPNGMGGVIVDYLQLMRVEREARNRDEAIGHITRGLKELAKELRCPVIALSQLNRGVETRGGKDKRPMLADLRESGNIEQDSDKVIFVHRESYWDKEADKRRAELIVAKNRGGETGAIEVGWAPWCVDFHDIEGVS